MATTTEADEFSYTVSGWTWARQKATVLRNARMVARRKRLEADGEPEVHVTLVWRQKTHQPPLEHC